MVGLAAVLYVKRESLPGMAGLCGVCSGLLSKRSKTGGLIDSGGYIGGGGGGGAEAAASAEGGATSTSSDSIYG